MKILMMTTELRDLVSIGGLAEAVASLSTALKTNGHDVRIALPYYSYIRQIFTNGHSPQLAWKGSLNLGTLPDGEVYQSNYQGNGQQIPLYLIRGTSWFEQAGSLENIYPPTKDIRSYMFFAGATLRFLSEDSTDWIPDVIHCHDYHSGLLPVYLRTRFHGKIRNKKVATIFTIHNLAFQGKTHPENLQVGGLPESLSHYNPGLSGMEYYGDINSLKGALVHADHVTTVSNTYANEIQSEAYGEGLEGVLSALGREKRLTGIVNGIDQEKWNPANLGKLSYDTTDLSTKHKIKQLIRIMASLEQTTDPLVAIRARWGYQKGWDLVVEALQKYSLYDHAQFLIVTRGQPGTNKKYQELWAKLVNLVEANKYRMAIISNDNPLSYLQYAGSDIFLMPSIYEPCGLTQMEAMQYGVIPVARKTGGIADTVDSDCGFLFDWQPDFPVGKSQIRNGTQAMTATLIKAFQVFQSPMKWQQMMQNAMERDNGWANRVSRYELLYKDVLSNLGIHIQIQPKQMEVASISKRQALPVYPHCEVSMPICEVFMPIPEKGILWELHEQR